jgi:hypothetical protein
MQSSAKLVSTHDRTNIETSIEQALAPYINKENILNLNIENEETQPKNDIVLKVSKNRVKVVEINGEKVVPKIKAPKSKTEAFFTPPDIVAVRNYFVEQKSVEIEAEKFYNYFQSNGWKVGGKAPMKDWQAAASNWILNIPQFLPQPHTNIQKQPTPGILNVTIGKNYSEPL